MPARPIETRGRKHLPGTEISVKLTPTALAITDQGADLLSARLGKAPSRAAWVRYLFDATVTSPPFGRVAASELRERWPDDSHMKTPHLITIKVKHDHLIWLRQWEFAIQQLDWTRHLYRNETLSFLIEAYGPMINRILKMQIASAQPNAHDQ